MPMSNRLTLCLCAVSLCSVSAGAACAFGGGAGERKVTRTELPAPVQAAADEQTKGAKVRGYSTETENGQREYEVDMVVNGHDKDVMFASDGRVVEVEEAVAMDALSPEVRAGLMAKAATGKITKIESVTKGGKIVAYEALVMTAGKRSEIQVGPDGGKLAHEE
jgi:hypothetical protein